MKNARQIIVSLQNQPQFSKLSKYKCIKKIESLFRVAIQKSIKFSYIKNNTLFFVLNNSGAKQEFDNNIQTIKSALKFHLPQECLETEISDIKAFVTHTPEIKQEILTVQQQTYKERATGAFSITIKDEKLNALVKTIQNIIKDKNDTTRDY